MDTQKLKTILLLLISTFAALYLGVAAATAQTEVIVWIVGGLAVTACIAMGRSIWLLIPFTASLSLTLFYLPGKPDAAQVGQFAFILFSTLLFLMRRLRLAFRFTELEGWCLLLFLCVIQVYLRNPVGVSAIGSGSVGGKPYFNFGIGFVTALALCSIVIPPSELKWFVRLSIIGGLLSFVLGVVGVLAPRLGLWLGNTTAESLSAGDFNQTSIEAGQADRKAFFNPLAGIISRWVGSVKEPLLACFHPLYALLVLISIGAAALSGFRNQIAIVGLTYLVAQFYRGGFKSVLLCGILGIIGVLILSLTNSIIPLPPNIQRVMTIFPGSWEQRYKDDAENSTEWRVEMWKAALTNKRYIANTLLGDGLGMTAFQLEQSQILAEKKAQGTTGWDFHRETVLINGDFHSGPVQTIKTIGYVGLLVLLLGMMRLAVHAHRQILRCRGTEWFSTVLFICIPLIWFPVFFVFIFGGFASGSLELLIGCATVRLLEKSLPLPAYVPQPRPYSLPVGISTKQQSASSAVATR